MRHRPTKALLLGFVMAAAVSPPAWGEDDEGETGPSPSDPSPSDPSASGPSAEDLAAFEAALAADQAASQEAAGSTASAGARGISSLNPDISLIADVALAAFSVEEPRQTGGHDPTENGFNLQQLELAVSKPVDPYFRFDGNLVFSSYAVEIEEVYATTLALPGRTQLRVGKFLTRFGRFNPTHPHQWGFVDQPFAIGRIFGSEGNRGLGVEGSVMLPLPWYVELVASETMAGGESTARSFYGSEDLGVQGPLDFQTTTAVRQFFPFGPDLSLMWGLSWATGPNATGRTNRTEVYGTDLFLKYRPVSRASYRELTFHSEWFHRRRQVPEEVLWDTDSFTSVQWRFLRRLGAGARYEWGSPVRDLSGQVTTDDLDPEWTGHRTRISGALTFWPTEFSRLRGQVARDRVEWEEPVAWSFFLAFEFSVGAHGAHPF